MGLYVNGPELGTFKQNQFRDFALLDNGLSAVSREEFLAISPSAEAIGICVVSNLAFDAAGIAFCRNEASDFAHPSDPRPKSYYRATLEWIRSKDPDSADALVRHYGIR